MNAVDRLAGSWAGRLFAWLKSWMIPRWVRRRVVRAELRRIEGLMAFIRETVPAGSRSAAVAEFRVRERVDALHAELVALCRHRWRPNVAWSHLERCDECGTDRPATS